MKTSNILNLFGTFLFLLLLASPRGVYAEGAEKPFTIGAILPLSGIPADYGDSMRKAIQLATEDHPENFTHIRFLFEDAAYDPKLAVQAFMKLRDIDKADLIYVWGVTFCKALSSIAESSKTPMVAQCIDRVSGKGRRYVIRFMNYTDQYAAKLHSYLREHKLKNYGVVLSDNAYVEEVFESFKEQLMPDETLTIIDRYPTGQYELRSTLSKIRVAKIRAAKIRVAENGNGSYDAIGVFLSLGQIAQFYKQRREQGLEFQSFGTNFFESATEIAASGQSMDGAVYASNRVREEFIKKFTARYGRPSQSAYAALAYEFAAVSGELFNNDPDISASDILERFSTTGIREGIATGPYRYRELPEVGRFFDFDLTMKIVEGAGVRQLQ